MKKPYLGRWLVALAALAIAPLGAWGQFKPRPKPLPAPTPPVPAIANPVLAGDYPDPSITKVGNTYWASATSSNWGPVFPLLKSTNLTDWTLVGHVFPHGRPAWADYYFWAPEISEDRGRTYVYYTAHKRGGNLCVAVASADRPEGPYRDHGPLVGQPDGSIDGFPMLDEHGQAYLIWKEDGNSVQKPTPIWAQRLSDDRTTLVGEKKELIRNTAPWEGNLVEGPSVVRHNGYFYMFYAANGCCGHNCTYGTGVARAQSLLGPWEKYAKNPILTKNDAWTCPGHGTTLQRDGRWYMLHHAYEVGSFEYVGRQGVLSEFSWTKDGWPEFLNNHSIPSTPAKTPAVLADEFAGTALAPWWQWPITADEPQTKLAGGQLRLVAQPAAQGGALLGRSTLAANYTAAATLLAPAALPAGTLAGVAAIGDPDNALSLLAGQGQLQVQERRAGKTRVVATAALPATAAAVQLRVQNRAGIHYQFAWSLDGRTWTNLLPAGESLNGQFLPPWDRGVRVGLVAQGAAAATFERFELRSE
jgi:xylan 1,4-beta-xylosidase